MNLFYAPDVSKDIVTLSEDESKHCIQVLRGKKGDIIHLVDGKGKFFTGEIRDANPRECAVKVIKEVKIGQSEAGLLEVLIAPPKNGQRFEWFLEKATEVGVGKVSPIVCKRSARAKINLNRARKILLTAMKQSLRGHLPEIDQPIPFKQTLEQKSDSQLFIAHLSEGSPHLKDVYKKGKPARILIGPEGDFTDEELEQAKSAGYRPIILSSSRLRTETAGLVGCQIVSTLNES